MFRKRSLSPLIATILLIVVSVILITVVLTWGSGFAKENLNSVNTLDQLTKSDLSSFIVLDSFSQTETGNNIIIRNLHSFSDLNLIGYKLVTDSNYVFSNQLLYFDEVIGITPGEVRSLNIICFPNREFVLQLVNKDLTYVTLPIKISNYRSQAYCMGREGVVAAYDMTTIVEDTLIDISGNGNNGFFSGPIDKESNGVFFDDDNFLELEINESLKVTNNISVFCLIKPNESTDVYDTFAGRFDSGTNNRVWWIFRENSGKRLEVRIYPNGSSTPLKQYRSITPINDDEIYMVGFTFANNNLKLYINGVEITTSKVRDDEVNELFYSNEPLRLSASQSSTIYQNFFKGTMFDFKFYDRVLTDQEIYDYHSIMTNPLE